MLKFFRSMFRAFHFEPASPQKPATRRRRHPAFQLEALEDRIVMTNTQLNLDFDGNGRVDSLTDGMLALRRLADFSGQALVEGALAPDATRTDPQEIADYIDRSKATMLDIDGSENADSLTDGILALRYMAGFLGEKLVEGATDPGAPRQEAAAIISFLDGYNSDLDFAPPVLLVQLTHDTGMSPTDRVTSNPGIVGSLVDLSDVPVFSAGLNGMPEASYVSLLPKLQQSDQFSLTRAELEILQGAPLADGVHTLHVLARDRRGNVRTQNLTFTLDTLAPSMAQLDLAPSSDSGTKGDRQTRDAQVLLAGVTEANSFVTIDGLGTAARSAGDGVFRLTNVPLMPGTNSFALTVTDLAGNLFQAQHDITRADEAAVSDPVLRWNEAVLAAIKLDATPPPSATRAMALVSLAMLDVVSAVEGTPGYFVSLPAPAGISLEAALSSAAQRVMNYLYPAQGVSIQAVQTAALAEIADGAPKTQGIAFGNLLADAVIALRAGDGWDAYVENVPGSAPGAWQETGPMFAKALLPQWGDLTPFAVSDVAALVPPAPPALSSAEYAESLNEVQLLGRATGSARTADQTQIARFWADGSGTYTPPGHWNQIAAQFAAARGLSVGENARLFAMLNAALGDAAIVSWNTKYTYDLWRPATAIQNADLDGNDLTTPDTEWSSLLITPPFPEYTSGHSTFSAAAAEILTAYFGDNQAFSTTSVGLPGVTRNFTSFRQAAEEAGRSRILGGIHFEFTNQVSLASGQEIGREVLERFSLADDTQAPSVVFLAPADGIVTNVAPTIQGWVLDNLAGVASATVQLGTGAILPLALDAHGRFAYMPTVSADGTHVLHFRAVDSAGLESSSYDFTFTLDAQAPTLAVSAPLGAGALLPAEPRLTGTVNGTGSAIVRLTYRFGAAPEMPINVAADGAFDELLDVSRLSFGNHELTLAARDAAGNVTTSTRNVYLGQLAPFQVSSVTPGNGEADVGSNVRPQIFFSRPVNVSTLNSNNVYVTDPAGVKLPATIVPSQDGSFVWLFFANPLPSASIITLHLDGSTIQAQEDGALLDGDVDGTPGGTFQTQFSTVNLSLLTGTSLVGKVVGPGLDLKPMTFDDIRAGADGILHSPDDVFLNPIAGVKVFILGREAEAVFTAADGTFTFSSMPVGTVKLAIDGRTATNAPAGFFYPEMVMDLVIEAGRQNTMMGSMGPRELQEANDDRPEVYLPLLQTSMLKPVSNSEPTEIGVDGLTAPNLSPEQQSQLKLVVQPGSVIGEDGLPLANPQIGISMVPPEFVRDMLPEDMRAGHTVEITIQAPGATVFNVPIEITFPNLTGAAPGTKLTVFSFDHTTGLVVPDGTATVSADGKTATTDPGSGIRAPGWHFIDDLVNIVLDARDLVTCLSADVSDALDQSFAAMLSAISLATGVLDIVPWDAIIGIGQAFDSFLSLVSAGTSVASDVVANNEIGTLTRAQLLTSLLSAGASLVPIFGLPVSIMADITNAILSWYSAKAQFEKASNAIGKLGDTFSRCISMLPQNDPEVKEVADRIKDKIDDALSAVEDIANDLKADADHAMEGFNKIRDLAREIADRADGAIDTATANTIGEIKRRLEEVKNYFDGRGIPSLRDAFSNYSQRLRSIGQSLSPSVFPSISSIASKGAFFSVSSSSGDVVQRARTNSAGIASFRVAASSSFSVGVFSPKTFLSGAVDFSSGRGGTSKTVFSVSGNQEGFSSSSTLFSLSERIDADFDGLSAVAERAIGTSDNLKDTDRDGISDLEEIIQGLDPLGGRSIILGVVATLPLPGVANAIEVFDSTLLSKSQISLIASGAAGLTVVDTLEIFKPILLSQLALSGNAIDVAVDSTSRVAVVAADAGGLHFVDVADAKKPKLMRSAVQQATQVEIIDGIAFAAVGSQIFSFETLTGELFTTLNVPNGAAITGMTHEGAVLYTMDTDRTLRAFTVAEETLTLRGTLQMTHGGGKISVANGVVYAAARPSLLQGGFATADVSNPSNLVEISPSDNSASTAPGDVVVANGSGLALLGGAAFMPAENAVDLVDVRNPANTDVIVTRFTLPAAPQGIAIASGIGYVVSGTGGLQVVNYVGFDTLGQAPTATLAGPAGANLQEGSLAPFRVTVTDDVQVRNVELLLNGQVVANDVSAPFDLSAVLPTLAAGATSVSFQIRAVDTGGNVGLSNTLTYNLTRDLTPPRLVGSSPAADGAGFRVRDIALRFNEPVDAARLSTMGLTLTNLGPNFRLGGGDDTVLEVESVEALSSRRLVVRTAAALPEGRYQLTVNPTILADQAGNAVAAPITLTFTSFDLDEQNAVAWISDADGDWNNAGNWSTGQVPGPNDNVVIDRKTSNPKIRIPSGNVTVRSIIAREEFILNGGNLTVTGASRIEGRFEISSGSTLTVDGSTALFMADGEAKIDGGSFVAKNGGQIRLPGATSYTATQQGLFRITGAGSVLDLRNVTSLTGTPAGITLEALSGGLLDLRGVTTFSTTGAYFSSSTTSLLADGANSRIDLTSLGQFTNSVGPADFTARSGGQIDMPLVTVLNGARLNLDRIGAMPTAQISTFTNGYLNLSGVAFTVPALTDAQGSVIEVNGVAVSLPVLEDLTNGGIILRGGGTVNVPELHRINGGNFDVAGGVTLAIPRAASYTATRQGLLKVSGAGSVLDLRNVTSLTGTPAGITLEALSGGLLDLRGVTAFSTTGAYFSSSTTSLFADGANSRIDLTSLGQFTNSVGPADFTARSGAQIDMPLVTVLNGARLNLDRVGAMPVAQISTFTNGYLNLSGVAFTFPALTDAQGSVIEVNGVAVSLPVLEDLTNGGITLRGGGTVNVPQLHRINGGNFDIAGGVTLALPLANSYTATRQGLLKVSGAGSVLDLRNVTSLTGTPAGITLEALSGGLLDLRGVTTFSTTGAYFSSSTTSLLADGANSRIDLTSLGQFTNSVNPASFTVKNGGELKIGPDSNFAGAAISVESGGIITGSMTLQGTSVLNGHDGTVVGNVVNRARVAPGLSPGAFTIQGNYTQTVAGKLYIEIGGPGAGLGYDQFRVQGAVTLDGELNIVRLNNYDPALATEFLVMSYLSRTGTFALLVGADFVSGKILDPRFDADGLTLVVAAG